MDTSLRILLIDDTPEDRALVIRKLRQEYPDVRVTEITAKDDLTRALEGETVDLVITDYQLHWSDGLEVLRTIKARQPDCPVIMFTGTGSEEVAAAGMKAGLDDYVLKSTRHLDLLPSTVRSVLARAEQRRALEEAETRYQALFDSVPVGLFRTAPDGRFLDANECLVQMLGFPDQETLLAAPVNDIYVDGEDRQRWLAQQRDDVISELELQLRRRDGSLLWACGGACIARDADGRVLYLEGFLQDITARKVAEEQLTALNRTLEQRVADRTAESRRRASQLQKLTAQMTQAEERERRRLAQLLHDHLQQLLAAARLKVTAAGRELEDPRAVARIDEAVGLVDQAIAESRSLTKELSPPVLYDRGLGAALKWLARQIEEKHALPVTVQADADAEPQDQVTTVSVFQAARELIFNAVKHSRASRVQIRLRKLDDHRLELVVEDDGVGFSPDEVKVSSDSGGFGLFSIRERLDLLDGELRIVSAPGQGTQAAILVPSRQAQGSDPPADAADNCSPAPANVPSAEMKSIRVLLADDHPVLRKGLAELLMEYPDLDLVGEAGDGREAVERTLQLQPDVVLMDVAMPRMDGIEATRRIKEAAPEICVIGLSMYEQEDMATAMREAGASGYLAKNVGIEELVAAIVAQCPQS